MAKAVNLSHLIYDWTRTRPKLRGRISIVGSSDVNPIDQEYNVGQIRMKVVDADVYDPEIWIANIEATRVIFRCDLRPYVQVYEEHVVEAEDPEFFKKLEKFILKFSNV